MVSRTMHAAIKGGMGAGPDVSAAMLQLQWAGGLAGTEWMGEGRRADYCWITPRRSAEGCMRTCMQPHSVAPGLQ